MNQTIPVEDVAAVLAAATIGEKFGRTLIGEVEADRRLCDVIDAIGEQLGIERAVYAYECKYATEVVNALAD